ncbi:MAG: BlaI/MecI/CopY family transcriptional regulator [Candidatus Solibacter sp.]
MFSDRKSRKPLSNLEHLVMEIVWQNASCSADEVRVALAGRHPMKESTARTMLTRLEEKGYVRHTVEGRTNKYTGVEAPNNVAAQAVRQIIDRFCGGSVEQLLVGMVANEVVDSQELERLAQRIAHRKEQKGK